MLLPLLFLLIGSSLGLGFCLFAHLKGTARYYGVSIGLVGAYVGGFFGQAIAPPDYGIVVSVGVSILGGSVALLGIWLGSELFLSRSRTLRSHRRKGFQGY